MIFLLSIVLYVAVVQDALDVPPVSVSGIENVPERLITMRVISLNRLTMTSLTLLNPTHLEVLEVQLTYQSNAWNL